MKIALIILAIYTGYKIGRAGVTAAMLKDVIIPGNAAGGVIQTFGTRVKAFLKSVF